MHLCAGICRTCVETLDDLTCPCRPLGRHQPTFTRPHGPCPRYPGAVSKRRAYLSTSLANRPVWESASTCCVCEDCRRPFQIHHGDGNSANNDPDNLFVLCSLCHSRAHQYGAFGRDLTPSLLRLHRTKWLDQFTSSETTSSSITFQAQPGRV